MLFLDGIYAVNKHGTSRFRGVKAPTSDELTQLTRQPGRFPSSRVGSNKAPGAI
jgi:hypothetical protein